MTNITPKRIWQREIYKEENSLDKMPKKSIKKWKKKFRQQSKKLIIKESK